MKKLVLFLGLLFATNLFANTVLKVNPKRLVKVIGTIDFSILTQAKELRQMAIKSKKPVFVFLNSPGGIVNAGEVFIDAVVAARSRGTPVVCVSATLAASMAFNILPFCSARYALPNTQLLFHPARIISRYGFTYKQLRYFQGELEDIESKFQPILQNMMGIDDDEFSMHYYAETLWEAHRLLHKSGTKWLRIVNDIRGIKDIHTIRKYSPILFRETLKHVDGPVIVN